MSTVLDRPGTIGRTVAVGIVAVISLWVLVGELESGWLESRRDVDSYYWAGEVVRSGGEPRLLYFGDPEEIWPYMYPPSLAAAWGVATALNRRTAYVAWAGVLLTASILVCVAVSGGAGWWYPLALLPYLLMAFRVGQVEPLMVLLVLAFLASLGREGRFGGRLALAAAFHLKLYPILALPALAGRRKELWRILGWATGLLLLPLGWLLPLFGAEAPSRLLDLYGTYALRLLVQPPWGLSWGAFVPRWVVVLVLLGMLLLAYRLAFRGEPDGAVRLAIPAGVLCSPVFFPYSAVVMALLMPRLRGPSGAVTVGLFGVAGTLAWFVGRPVTFAIPVVCFAVWVVGWYQLTSSLPAPDLSRADRQAGQA